MTGPNLLAWAKEIAAVADKYFDADGDLFTLARAILADEEERKRDIRANMTIASGVQNTPTRASHIQVEPEPPSE